MTVGEFLDKLFSRIGYVFKSIGDLIAGALDILLGKTAIMDAQIGPFIIAVLLSVILIYLLVSWARHIFVWLRKGPSFWADAVREELSCLKPALKALLVGLGVLLVGTPVLLGIVKIVEWATR